MWTAKSGTRYGNGHDDAIRRNWDLGYSGGTSINSGYGAVCSPHARMKWTKLDPQPTGNFGSQRPRRLSGIRRSNRTLTLTIQSGSSTSRSALQSEVASPTRAGRRCNTTPKRSSGHDADAHASVECSSPGWREPALLRLEPYAGKLARTVLRGGCGGDVVSLPDHYPLKSRAMTLDSSELCYIFRTDRVMTEKCSIIRS